MQSKTVLSVFALRPYRIGGCEIFARELSEQLASRGWKSVLCFLESPTAPVCRFLSSSHASIEVIQVRRPSGIPGFCSLLAKYRPSIVHLGFTGFLTAYPWLAKLMHVEKVYFTDHTSPAEGFIPRPASPWKRAAAQTIIRPIDRVISVSDYGYDSFTARELLPKDRFCRIYNGVDLTRAAGGMERREEFRKRYGIPRDRLVVTQVSSMIPQKGMQDLLAAARLVIAAEPRAHFFLVGEGPQRAALTQLAAKLGIASHVTFTGVVEDPLGEGLYGASDVVCLMSRWEEVFGFVIAEGMASSRPIVATRVGAIPELVADGKTGFLVDRGDTESMAHRIVELLQDAGLRDRLGAAGQRVAVERFDHRTNVARLLELYGI